MPIDADPEPSLSDCYTYMSIDPVTKLMPCYMLGYRETSSEELSMADLKARFKVDAESHLVTRLQLTTDAMSGYSAVVAEHFGRDADYEVLNKFYLAPQTHNPGRAPLQPQQGC